MNEDTLQIMEDKIKDMVVEKGAGDDDYVIIGAGTDRPSYSGGQIVASKDPVVEVDNTEFTPEPGSVLQAEGYGIEATFIKKEGQGISCTNCASYETLSDADCDRCMNCDPDYSNWHQDDELAEAGEDIEATLGVKQTDGKMPIDLLPWPAIMEIVRVLEFGAQKYNDWNWSKGVKYMSLMASAMRHCVKFICGEDRDAESGLPHLAHAMCNLMFVVHYHMMGMDEELDNRPEALRNGMCTISEPDEALWKKYAGSGMK